MKEKKTLSPPEGGKKGLVAKTKDAMTVALDQNGDGQIGIDDIILAAMKTPGVRISRAAFLEKELFKYYPEDLVARAVAFNPAHAGIPGKVIDKIADDVIKFERNCVSGISAALGMPGGWAMAATIPADIVQYYGYTLRAAQKLMYLYGFPEIHTNEDGVALDSSTMNTVILCLGIMNGVAGANNAIKAMAQALAIGVQKQLMKQALTKGTIFPIVRNIAKWFGVKLTKSLFTGAIKKAIPVVGGVIGGGITFATFKPCCDKLKKALQNTRLSNPEYELTPEEAQILEDILEGVEPTAEEMEEILAEVVDVEEFEEIPTDEVLTEDAPLDPDDSGTCPPEPEVAEAGEETVSEPVLKESVPDDPDDWNDPNKK